MKRFAYSLLIAISLLVPAANLAAVAPVSAVDIFPVCTGNNDNNTNAGAGNPTVPGGSDLCKEQHASSTSTQNPIIHTISIAIDILAFIIGIASVIMIIISGFRMVLSRGDPQNFANARNAIIYALVGLAIAFAAGTIVGLVLNNL